MRLYQNEEGEPLHLEFKHSISRGRDTYGYNIVTLYVNGKKVARCSGGGYDMRGTCLGDFIQERFQAELLAIRARADCGYNGERLFKTQNENSLYGMTFYESHQAKNGTGTIPPQIVLDGATGFSSMERVLDALGYHLFRLQSKGNESYLLEKNEVPA